MDVSAPIRDPDSLTPHERWSTEITYAKKSRKNFERRAKDSMDRYLDERDAINSEFRKFNIFWANVGIMESALYSQPPKASVSRKYPDYRDQVARVAALVMERMLQQDLNDPMDTFSTVMKLNVQDRLVAGLGTAWLRLETDTEDIPETEGGSLTNDTDSQFPGPEGGNDGFIAPPAEQDPSTRDPQPAGQAIPLKRIKDQRVAVDYVHFSDFLWSPCRVWSERRWTARAVYLSETQMKKRFGSAKTKLVSFAPTPTIGDNDKGVVQHEAIEKCKIYEIWDREERKIIWFTEECPEILDTREDFLNLECFEPCPTPLFANTLTNELMPRPDYYMVQDQYSELDTVNNRISIINEAIKAVGVYDKKNYGSLANMMAGSDNQMIPVDNWAMFAEQGGIAGTVTWMPLEEIVKAQERLMLSRDQIKAQIYELTGISDIVRGASKASETLGAQEIKAKFASIRIKKQQDEVGTYASEILRIKAEIQVKHFSPEILIRKSGITNTDNDLYIPSAIALLKSEEGFQWRIKIQAGSMAQADYDMEKKDATEFLSTVSMYLQNALPMTAQIPETKPIVLGLLKWGVSRFHNAADIEGMIDKQLDGLENKPPAPPPPDPKMAAVQAKVEGDKAKAQIDMQAQQQGMQFEQQKFQMELQMKQAELENKKQLAALDMQIKQLELQMKSQEIRLKLSGDTAKMQMDMAGKQQDIQAKQEEHAQNAQLAREQSQMELELQSRQGEQQLQQSKVQGEQKLDLDKKAAALKAKTQPKKGE